MRDGRSDLWATCVFVGLAACGGTVAPRAPLAPAAHEAQSWPTLSWEGRHDLMTLAVLPNMSRAWQEHDGAADPTMTCRTCHGANAEAVDYRMPNGLPPLDLAHLPSATSRDPREARMAKFMFDVVVPKMTDLLDATPYDPATRRGFYCFDCHPKGGT
jgi:hypothetical protein